MLFFSGFATLGYEMVWFRALRYLLGNGTYVLTAALVIFLLGLGFGSLLYRPALRFGRSDWNLGFAQLGIAIFALGAIGAEQLILTTPELHDQLSIFSQALREQPWAAGDGGLRRRNGDHAARDLVDGTQLSTGEPPLPGQCAGAAASCGAGLSALESGSISGAILAAVWIIPSWGTVGGTKLLAGVNIALAVLVGEVSCCSSHSN